MSNSQILFTWNFSTNPDIVPWIEEKLHIREEFQQFSRKNMFVRVPGKLSKVHSKVLVFSNPGDNIRFLVKLRDRFVPLFSYILGPCPLDWRSIGLCNVFLKIFQAPFHNCCSWNTVGTPLHCVVFSNPGDKVMISAEMSWSQDLRVWHKRCTRQTNRQKNSVVSTIG